MDTGKKWGKPDIPEKWTGKKRQTPNLWTRKGKKFAIMCTTGKDGMEHKMARKLITKEEIEKLTQSPYVAKATPYQVSFTKEFKQMAYQGIMEGKLMREILIDSGIDVGILGDRRIWALTDQIKKAAEREGGFEDQRGKNRRKPKEMTEEQLMAERIERLEHELAYTRQEVEFLKKLQAANMEAQKKWESRHRQK